MKKTILAALLIFGAAAAQTQARTRTQAQAETRAEAKTEEKAQGHNAIDIMAEVRADYQHEDVEGSMIPAGSGFKGKYLNLHINGNIGEHFTYSYRQRLNKANTSQSFFNATDWAHLTYSPDSRWMISAGKQVVGIGGYEYDRAPIDVYTACEFWNNFACYQFGASVSYIINGGSDKIMLQATQSPYRNEATEDTYAYNLMWTGSHGWFNSLYSVNLIEYAPGRFLNYLALGNHFALGDLDIYLDFMNRAAGGQKSFFDDCSIILEGVYSLNSQWNVFGKMMYDVNRSDIPADRSVLPGTELLTFGAGVEFFPLKDNRDVRLHANLFYTSGQNGNPAGTLVNGRTLIDAGVKWKIHILSR